jgi:hypothetical protein
MDLVVASSAQGDEILFGIIAEQTTLSNMMHLEFTHAPAMLAAPAVSLQNLSAQSMIGN